MSSRKQSAPPARRTTPFAAARWLAVAHRLAGRHRLTRRRLDAAIRWRRALARPGRFTQHNWAILPGPQWRLNLGLSVHLAPPPAALRTSWVQSSALTRPSTAQPLLQNTTFAPIYAHAQAHTWRTSIANHLVMKRFVTRQAPAVLQPMRILSQHVVHTAARPIVRERSRVQPLPLPRSAAAQARSTQTVAVESRPPLVRDLTAFTPAQQPRVPEINIAQIAEQVMRQLDHRISAWRERRGRA